jgi:GntR family transcriptional repressor for pyruvate dehydrogenase complex
MEGAHVLRHAKRKSLTDDVIQQVLQLIVGGTLRPGDKLPSERTLIQELGVSRSVVREALQSLNTVGAIEIRAGVGAFVARNIPALSELGSVQSIAHLVEITGLERLAEVRWTLEVAAAGLAARRAADEHLQILSDLLNGFTQVVQEPESSQRTDRLVELDMAFHRGVVNACGNPLFLRLLEPVNELLIRARQLALTTPNAPARAFEHHWKIYAALQARDSEAARKAMEGHLAEATQDAHEALDQDL